MPQQTLQPAEARFEIMTPSTGTHAALAAVHITAPDAPRMDELIDRLRLRPLPVGAIALRTLGTPPNSEKPVPRRENADHDTIDVAVAARPNPQSILLTPHASPLVLRKIAGWLESQGVARATAPDPRARYPESRDPVEACTLDSLAFAASPLAVDALLRQPELWRREPEPKLDPARDHTLSRLLRPPTVVAVGHPNVGKSTLVNALARRAVAITADLPGTTRDHVGVTLDLAGLVVHWIDTPGIPGSGSPADPIEAAALSLAHPVIAGADLLVSCADASSPFLDADTLPIRSGTPVIRCGTRADLAPPPPCDLITAAALSRGLDEAASAIRDTLVPPTLLDADIPWRFHPALP